MARICCVEGCDAQTRDDVTYFNFPIKQSLVRAWREASASIKVTADSMICSQHFAEDDYETIRGKVRLKAKVVPSIFGGKINNISPKKKLKKKISKKKTRSTNDSTECSDKEVNSHDSTKHNDTHSCKANGNRKSKKEAKPAKEKQEIENDLEKQESNSESPKVDSNTNNQEIDNESLNQETDKEGKKQETSEEVANQETGKEELNQENKGLNQETDKEVINQETVIEESQEVNLYTETLFEMNWGDSVQRRDSVDENGLEKCTIECVPEAILNQDSDSNSDTDLHKGDIEDIIANYHIKQNKEVAERLKASQENQENDKPEENKQEPQVGKQESGKKEETGKDKKEEIGKSNSDIETIDDDDDDDDVQFLSSEKIEPEFIEMSVEAVGDSESKNDCLILLEKVQVDIDPATLMLEQEDQPEESSRKEDPISLLTSSDDDDVILEEPHVDTVEVSDETDEDDVPLVRLVKPKPKRTEITRILWGNLYEYFCYQCHFKTTSRADFKKHQSEHSTIIQVCEICNFTTASRYQFAKHKKNIKKKNDISAIYVNIKRNIV